MTKYFLWLAVLLFIGYFSFITVVRYQHIYASYFDLGIMNQTVYNTYKALTTFDFSRVLEMTDPFGPDQIKRMAIHNDIFLALLAPFYFIHAGPETLLVIQAIVVGLGAFGIFGIAKHAFEKHRHKDLIALVFSLAYLMYPALGRATIFEFHAVVLATTFLIFMFYFWLKRKYALSFVFVCLALLTKENVALTTFFFAGYALLCHVMILPNSKRNLKKIWQQLLQNRENFRFCVTVMAVSLLWFLVSVFVIIPHFRGSNHFALKYYDDGITSVANAWNVSTLKYFLNTLGPLGFLSLLAPLKLLIALPEYAINLFSSSSNMRNIIYHYTAVITPWVFISAIYGMRNLLFFMKKRLNWIHVLVFVAVTSISFAFWLGPLPFSIAADTYALTHIRPEQKDIELWADRLKNENIKVSASSQIAPIFTSRRYFYSFAKDYDEADYIVIRLPEVYNYPEKNELIPVYEQLVADGRYAKIFDRDTVVVYKRL